MATLKQMVASAYAAKRIGNLTILPIARYDIDSEADTARYLDDYAAVAIRAVEAWDGKLVARTDTDHPVADAKRRLEWLIAIGADAQVATIKTAIAGRMARRVD